MKKLLCVLLCVIVICFSACGQRDQANGQDSTGESIKESTPAPSVSVNDQSTEESTPAQSETEEPTASSELHSAYASILRSIIKAFPWNDDDLTIVPEHPELSYMYYRCTAVSEIGFALVDLDRNGQEELILSGPDQFVYDVYTISDDQAVHLFASGERNSYILRENGWIQNAWAGSAATSGHDFYKLNNEKLDFVERITLDAYYALEAGVIKELSEATDDNCFFVSPTDQYADYKSVTADEAMEKIEAYQKANQEIEIRYTLLSDYKD